jgi:hypothetical protein
VSVDVTNTGSLDGEEVWRKGRRRGGGSGKKGTRSFYNSLFFFFFFFFKKIVQLYYSDVIASVVRYNKQLVGFQRVAISAGQTVSVSFKLNAQSLAFYNVNILLFKDFILDLVFSRTLLFIWYFW